MMKGNARLDLICKEIIDEMYYESALNTIDVETITLQDSFLGNDGHLYRYEMTFRVNGNVKEFALFDKTTGDDLNVYAEIIKKRLNELLDERYKKGDYMETMPDNEGVLDPGFKDNQDFLDYMYG